MPTWDSIRAIHLHLNTNAASVPSNLGGGQHVHLGLTIGGAEYQTLTGHLFVRPANPGVTLRPKIPMNYQHNEQIKSASGRMHQEHISSVQCSTQRSEISSLERLTKPTSSALKIRTQHLYTTYGRITSTKLDKNNRAMKKDYDATLPIEHLAEQIKTAVTIAGNANQPYTAAQVLSITYNLVFKTG
eukprot:9825753-Ditylum_brightwellii.AAC.1